MGATLSVFAVCPEPSTQADRDRSDHLAGPLRTYGYNGSPVLKKYIRETRLWMPAGPALSYDGKNWEAAPCRRFEVARA